MKQFMLSLASNPHNPFEDYDSWKQFDRREGFDTDGLLARLVPVDVSVAPELDAQVVEQAIDDILANPAFAGLYKKVSNMD